jgi:hypothetical protein
MARGSCCAWLDHQTISPVSARLLGHRALDYYCCALLFPFVDIVLTWELELRQFTPKFFQG